MYSERVEKRLKEFVELYGIAESAYKRLQTLLNVIDDKIHNEFRYCSRGLKEFLSESCQTDDDEKLEYLQKATHATKNAFNDSIDLILGYSSSKIRELSSIDTGKELVIFVPNIQKVMEAISRIHNQITDSRANVENRINIYKQILESNDFELVISFCEQLPIVEDNKSAEYSRPIEENKKIIRENQKFIIKMCATVGGSIVAIIFGIPNMVKFLSQFCPWLAQFSHF